MKKKKQKLKPFSRRIDEVCDEFLLLQNHKNSCNTCETFLQFTANAKGKKNENVGGKEKSKKKCEENISHIFCMLVWGEEIVHLCVRRQFSTYL